MSRRRECVSVGERSPSMLAFRQAERYGRMAAAYEGNASGMGLVDPAKAAHWRRLERVFVDQGLRLLEGALS